MTSRGVWAVEATIFNREGGYNTGVDLSKIFGGRVNKNISFIHYGHFYSAPSSPLLLRGAPDYSTDTVSELHADAQRQLQVKDLPKVPIMVARAGVEPTTLRLKAIDSTKAPPCPTQPRRHHVPRVDPQAAAVSRRTEKFYASPKPPEFLRLS